jgi:hypothetical protein
MIRPSEGPPIPKSNYLKIFQGDIEAIDPTMTSGVDSKKKDADAKVSYVGEQSIDLGKRFASGSKQNTYQENLNIKYKNQSYLGAFKSFLAKATVVALGVISSPLVLVFKAKHEIRKLFGTVMSDVETLRKGTQEAKKIGFQKAGKETVGTIDEKKLKNTLNKLAYPNSVVSDHLKTHLIRAATRKGCGLEHQDYQDITDIVNDIDTIGTRNSEDLKELLKKELSGIEADTDDCFWNFIKEDLDSIVDRTVEGVSVLFDENATDNASGLLKKDFTKLQSHLNRERIAYTPTWNRDTLKLLRKVLDNPAYQALQYDSLDETVVALQSFAASNWNQESGVMDKFNEFGQKLLSDLGGEGSETDRVVEGKERLLDHGPRDGAGGWTQHVFGDGISKVFGRIGYFLTLPKNSTGSMASMGGLAREAVMRPYDGYGDLGNKGFPIMNHTFMGRSEEGDPEIVGRVTTCAGGSPTIDETVTPEFLALLQGAENRQIFEMMPEYRSIYSWDSKSGSTGGYLDSDSEFSEDDFSDDRRVVLGDNSMTLEDLDYNYTDSSLEHSYIDSLVNLYHGIPHAISYNNLQSIENPNSAEGMRSLELSKLNYEYPSSLDCYTLSKDTKSHMMNDLKSGKDKGVDLKQEMHVTDSKVVWSSCNSYEVTMFAEFLGVSNQDAKRLMVGGLNQREEQVIFNNAESFKIEGRSKKKDCGFYFPARNHYEARKWVDIIQVSLRQAKRNLDSVDKEVLKSTLDAKGNPTQKTLYHFRKAFREQSYYLIRQQAQLGTCRDLADQGIEDPEMIAITACKENIDRGGMENFKDIETTAENFKSGFGFGMGRALDYRERGVIDERVDDKEIYTRMTQVENLRVSCLPDDIKLRETRISTSVPVGIF